MFKNQRTGIITGLQRRLLLLLVAALLPVFVMLTVWSFQERQESLTQAADKLTGAARLAISGVEKHVEGSRQLLNAVSNGPSLKSGGLVELCNEFLTNIHRNNSYYSNIGFIDVNGNIVCHAMGKNPQINVSDRDYFQRTLGTKSFAIGTHQIGRVTGKATLPFGMPVYDNAAAIKGVAYAALDMEQLARELVDHISLQIDIVMLDRNGTIIGSNAPQGGNQLGKPYPDRSLFEALRPQSNTTFEKPDSKGTPTMYATAALFDDSGPGIYVVANMPRESVTAPVTQALALQLVLITAVAFLGLVFARWIGDAMLVKPARRLLTQMNQLNRRDDESLDDQPLMTADPYRDPLASLSIAFDRYARRLQHSEAERQAQLVKLETTQNRLLAAQRIAKVGNWERDFVQRTLWWSEHIYVILELDPASFTPSMKQLGELIFPDDLAHCAAASACFFKGQGPLDLTHRIVTGDGKILWVRERGELHLGPNGQPLLAFGTLQDVTEQVLSERLLETEARALKALSLGMSLKAVLEEVLLGMDAILPRALTSVMLMAPDGKRLLMGASPHLPAAFMGALDGLAIGPTVGSCGTAAFDRKTVIVNNIDSDPLWSEHRALAQVHGLRACWSVPVFDAAGQILAVFAVYYKQARQPSVDELMLAQRAASIVALAIESNRKEAALRSSEERFSHSFQDAAAGMAIANLDGQFIEVNPAYCRMLGYTATELCTMDIRSVTCPEDWPNNQILFQDMKDGRRSSFVIEKRYVTQQRTLTWIRISVSLVRDANGQAQGFMGIAEDINLQRETALALRQTRDALDTASRVSRLGAWWVDLTCADLTVQLSDIACEIHQLPSGSVLTKEQAIAMYTPDDAPIIRKSFDACASDGVAFDHELSLVKPAGEHVWVRSIGEAVRDDRGQIVRVQGAMQDISARKQAALDKSALEARLTTTLDNISDGFATIDRDWRMTFVNRQAGQLLKRDRSQLLGHLLQDVFPPVEGTSFVSQYVRAIREKQAVHFEEFYPPLGLWLNLSVYPSAAGLAIYFRDVTGQRAAKEQLRLLETAVSRLNDIVLITEAEPFDAPGPRIVFVNDAFERLTGYRREEVIGQTPRILQGPNTQRAELDRIGSALKKWHPVTAELINYTKSGQEIWLELDIVPIANAEGWFTHWVAVERDITERKKAQLEMQELNAELENRVQFRTAQLQTANRELEAFSYSVSHDLRSPLNTVNGFGQLLQKSNENNLNDKGKHYLNRIRSGTQQMGELIEGLLALAKLSRDALHPGTLDLSEMARRVEKELREREPERQVAMHIQPDLLVRGDATLLMVVVQNLLANAWKYTSKQADARIEIGAQQATDGGTVYFVRDNGAGFDMAHANKLFGAFQRLHAPSDFTGTGIGLANVKRVIERHGGQVWAEGHLNEGATFFFTINSPAV